MEVRPSHRVARGALCTPVLIAAVGSRVSLRHAVLDYVSAGSVSYASGTYSVAIFPAFKGAYTASIQVGTHALARAAPPASAKRATGAQLLSSGGVSFTPPIESDLSLNVVGAVCANTPATPYSCPENATRCVASYSSCAAPACAAPSVQCPSTNGSVVCAASAFACPCPAGTTRCTTGQCQASCLPPPACSGDYNVSCLM